MRTPQMLVPVGEVGRKARVGNKTLNPQSGEQLWGIQKKYFFFLFCCSDVTRNHPRVRLLSLDKQDDFLIS